jgi:hypothetical protein
MRQTETLNQHARGHNRYESASSSKAQSKSPAARRTNTRDNGKPQNLRGCQFKYKIFANEIFYDKKIVKDSGAIAQVNPWSGIRRKAANGGMRLAVEKLRPSYLNSQL